MAHWCSFLSHNVQVHGYVTFSSHFLRWETIDVLKRSIERVTTCSSTRLEFTMKTSIPSLPSPFRVCIQWDGSQ